MKTKFDIEQLLAKFDESAAQRLAKVKAEVNDPEVVEAAKLGMDVQRLVAEYVWKRENAGESVGSYGLTVAHSLGTGCGQVLGLVTAGTMPRAIDQMTGHFSDALKDYGDALIEARTAVKEGTDLPPGTVLMEAHTEQ